MNKEPRISVRVSAALKARVERAAADARLDEPTIVRQCLEAFCDHLEAHGTIPVPLAFAAPVLKKNLSAYPPARRHSMELNEPKPKPPSQK